MSEELLTQIERLEAENRRLREREKNQINLLTTLIEKLPIATIAVTGDMLTYACNPLLLELGGARAQLMAEEHPSHSEIPVREILPGSVCELIETVHRYGSDLEQEIELNSKAYYLRVFSIRRTQMTLALLRNLSHPQVKQEELIARLNKTIDRNLSMIQQVAFLLGEEVSENTKVIHSVIRLLEGQDKS